MKQCLQETVLVVDVEEIKPFTTNDIPPSSKITFQNNRNNGTMCKILLKSLIKTPEQLQVRFGGCLI